MDGGSATGCTVDDDCDNGLFCDGTERCRPDAPDADERGCVEAASPACLAGQTCDEDGDRCATECATGVDADGDGHASRECGGDDCDDADPNRYPGNTEICDADDHDEDCDPTTFGVRDGDGDGEPDAACCNEDADGVRHCGSDCDDTRAGVNPTVPEVCDGRDNDCDGEVDEDVLITFTVDADGDGHGSAAPDAETMEACFAPDGFAASANDCDDAVGDVHPGAREVCDEGGVDEDCDGTANPDTLCTCTAPDSRACAAPGRCSAGTEVCDGLTGEWGACSIAPIAEICNGEDDDCDGTVDEGTTVTCYADADDDGFADSGVSAEQQCPVSGRSFVGGCPGNFTNRAPFGDDVDCDDGDPDRNPGEVEVCNMVDDDCDGTVDESVDVVCYTDNDDDTYAAPGTPATRHCPVAGRGSVGGCPSGFTNRSPLDGADCDDSAGGGAINPSASEICDAAMKDENCDGLANPPADCDCSDGDMRMCIAEGVCASGTQTCGAGGTWGACSVTPAPVEACDGLDDDCDGSADEIYECIQGSSPISCTTACGTPGSAACLANCSQDDCKGTEVCNGCDDNANGSVDETFACVQGATGIACTNACGNPGTGTCASDCSGVDPATCVGTEVCDYCDDDGDGHTHDEKGLATADVVWAPACDDFRLVSAVGCAAMSTFPYFEEAHLINRNNYHDAGAAWIDGQGVGWGPMTFRVGARVRNPTADKTADGWALILATGGSGDVGAVGGSLGVPMGRIGIAIEWRFYTNNPNADQADAITVRRLTGASPGVVLAGPIAVPETYMHLDWADTEVQQGLLVTYTPDDPTTVTREEERLLIQTTAGTTIASLTDEGLGTRVLDQDFVSGSPLDIGFTAASGGRRADVFIQGEAAMRVATQFNFQNVCY